MAVVYLTAVVSQIEPLDNASTELFLQLILKIISAIADEKSMYFMCKLNYITNIKLLIGFALSFRLNYR
jgi:hypothetical protein